MVNLCCYHNALGKPDEGVHKYRIFNLAIADIVLTFALAILCESFVSRIDRRFEKTNRYMEQIHTDHLDIFTIKCIVKISRNIKFEEY